AVERGEVEGHSTSWTALKVAHPDWLRDANVAILVQFALKRHAELPDIPTAVELARNDEERAILSAVMNATEVGTAFFTTPGVPRRSPRRAAARVRRHHEGPRIARRRPADQRRRVAALGRGAAEARGRGQRAAAGLAGQGPRRLHPAADELTASA